MQAGSSLSSDMSIGGHEPPARIILATDFSARSDRALDRAVYLSRQWGANLTAVSVIDPGTPPQQVLLWVDPQDDNALIRLAQRQLQRDVQATDVDVSVRLVKGGDVASQIRAVVEKTHAELLVIAVARNELFGGFVLGASVDHLVEAITVPMLVVRQRPMGPYRNIYVATDLSEPSRKALKAAASMFQEQPLTLYHARSTGLMGFRQPEGSVPVPERVMKEAQTFLEKTTALAQPERIRLAVEMTALTKTFAAKVIEEDIDLLVLGNRGASGMKSLFLGSNSAQLLQRVSCDVLLVP